VLGRGKRECAGDAHSQRRRAARTACGFLLAFLLGVSSGCYVYPPLVSTPSPGVELRLDLNDRGRVAMGPVIGVSAMNVEGVLKSPPDTAYVLGVTYVTYLRGQANKWNGEPVTVPRDFVANTTQRTLSKSRTWLTLGAAAAGVAALVLSFSLAGSGNAPAQSGGPGGGNSSRGIPIGIAGGH
jgi:hypothetical protein